MTDSLAADSGNARAGRPRRSHSLMHVLMLFATVSWAGNIIAGKLVLRSVTAPALAQLRVVAAGLIFAVLFFAWRGRPSLRLSRREWGLLAVIALFGITLNQLFFIGGIGKTSAAHAGLIVSLGPVLVLILSCALRLEELTLLKSVGAIVSFAGVAVLTTGKAAHSSGASWLGDAILLAGSAIFAYYTILVKEVADRYDTLTLNTLIFAIGALWMLPFGAQAVAHTHWKSLTVEAWGGFVFMVIFGSVLSYLFFAFALTELTASRVAAFSYLQPVIATVLGILLLRETVNPRVIAGGALILVGVYLAERERSDEKPLRGVVQETP